MPPFTDYSRDGITIGVLGKNGSNIAAAAPDMCREGGAPPESRLDNRPPIKFS